MLYMKRFNQVKWQNDIKKYVELFNDTKSKNLSLITKGEMMLF